jgi:hypothetical protein
MDDFLVTAKDPQYFMHRLEVVYNIKNTSEPKFYLGATNFGRPRNE